LVILRSCRELIDPKLKAQLVSPYTMVKLARKSRCRSVNVSIVRIVYQLNLPLIVTMTMGTLIWSVLPHHDILVWRALRGPYNWARNPPGWPMSRIEVRVVWQVVWIQREIDYY